MDVGQDDTIQHFFPLYERKRQNMPLEKRKEFEMIIEKHIEEGYSELMKVWESSIKATHHFLKEGDYLFYKKIIPKDFLPNLDLYVLGDIVVKGFMAVNGNQLEMLFIDAEYRGNGYGKKLLQYALHQLGVTNVDVDEQNEQAVDFTEK